MKNFTILVFVLIPFVVKAQEEMLVEKNLNNVQLGLFILAIKMKFDWNEK